MTKRVLITGFAGFVGRHISEYLASLGESIVIIGTDIVGPSSTNCDSFYKMDLSCPDKVAELIDQTKPDYIIHLAGTFGTQDSLQIYKVNVLCIAVLLEAVRVHAPDVVMLTIGSAAEYGHIRPSELPINEQIPCQPITPYGLSKLLATQVALYHHRVHGICTIIVRPFQLIGKHLTSRLAPGAFADQLKQALDKDLKVVKVGNLESFRDFLDIRDAVEAIWSLCLNPAPGEIYNLCSGRPTKIADLFQMMTELCGVNVRVEVDPALLRGAADISKVYGSYLKIKTHCGWQPKINLEQSLQAMFR